MASEYLKYLNRNVKPEAPPPELSPKEKWKNWWYYHWKIVAVAAVIFLAVLSMILKNLGITEPLPDYNIAYVGSHSLSEETTDAVTALFQEYGEDASGDGEVTVVINQYVMYDDTTDYDSIKLTASATTALDGDIATQTSYFFLLEDPKSFNAAYQLLADASGSLPPQDDVSWENKVLPLSSLTDTLPEEAASLFLGRRGFYDDNHTAKYKDACDRLWEQLSK